MTTDRRERDSASSPMRLSMASEARTGQHESSNAAAVRPSEPQRRYLERGLEEPGGKLPLFDRAGREVPKKTIEACIAHGWAEPWIRNPIKPDWLVCRLTAEGFRALGRTPPGGPGR
jgi:hypothetical protein